jgi:hypothetical protein
MTLPTDILRFEILLYLSLLLDALTAAFFGIAPANASGTVSPSVNLLSAVFIAALVYLVWLAARRRKSWACWTLLAFFVLSVVLFVASFGDMVFGLRTIVEIASIVLSAAGFYFAFTPDSRRWFSLSHP